MKALHRHITFYVEKEDTTIHRCGEPVLFGLKVNGAYEKPFEMEPTTGEHDYNTCTGCQNQLRQLTEHLIKGMKEKAFPLCCPGHKKLLDYKEFNFNHFLDAPTITAEKIIYTNQHFINHIGKEDWYNEITDYLTYGFESFGKFPNDTGNPFLIDAYLHYIKNSLKNAKQFPTARVKEILKFIDRFEHPKKQSTDFHILEGIYQQWLKEFPFDLSIYFGHLRDYFERQIPLCQEEMRYNKYLNQTIGQSHTKESLLEYLVNLTNVLLVNINGNILCEKGLVTEVDKVQIDLINQTRSQRLKIGYSNPSPDADHRYRSMIKEWLEDEKQYWKEIAPFIKKVKALSKERDVPNNLEVAAFCKILNNAEIVVKGEEEAIAAYCIRVCEQFKLNYADRVRQNFYDNPTAKSLKGLYEKILPLIEEPIRNKISNYLDKDQSAKHNLYA